MVWLISSRSIARTTLWYPLQSLECAIMCFVQKVFPHVPHICSQFRKHVLHFEPLIFSRVGISVMVSLGRKIINQFELVLRQKMRAFFVPTVQMPLRYLVRFQHFCYKCVVIVFKKSLTLMSYGRTRNRQRGITQ